MEFSLDMNCFPIHSWEVRHASLGEAFEENIATADPQSHCQDHNQLDLDPVSSLPASNITSLKLDGPRYICHRLLDNLEKVTNDHDPFQDISDKDSNGTSGTPDSELDSGISINGHYEDIRSKRLDYERIDEIKTMTGTRSKITLLLVTECSNSQAIFTLI